MDGFDSGNGLKPKRDEPHATTTRPTTTTAPTLPEARRWCCPSDEPENRAITAPGVQIDRFTLNGYNQHTVTGAAGVPIVDLTRPGNYRVACGYAWPGPSGGGCDTPGLVAGAQNFTGLVLSSFQGCYNGSAWTIQ